MYNSPDYLKKVIAKVERFCAYQDRCEHEVLQKLRGFQVNSEQTEQILSHLKIHSFLDDKRFAESYVSGKVKLKKWGRSKIKYKLLEKRIHRQLIENALDQIDQNLYQKNISDLIEKKRKELSNRTMDDNTAQQKIARYLASRGYEWSEISSYLFD